MIWFVLAIILLIWLGICGYFYVKQRGFIYITDAGAPDMDKASVFPGQILWLSPDDKPELELQTWYWPAKAGMDTILFFHGNNGNIEGRTAWMQFAIEAGWGLMMCEYRGYGGNPGSPSQKGLTQDGLMCFDHLVHDLGVPADRIHILGHSLGSGVASQVASRRPNRSLGLLSPFSSMRDTGFDRYPFLPTGVIMKDQWMSIDAIANVNCPLFIVSCDRDRTILPKRTLQLFKAALEPKGHLNIPGIDHGDIALSGGPQELVNFFDRVRLGA